MMALKRMFGMAAVLAALSLALLVPTASAAGPDHSKLGALDIVFDEGVLCDFAVRWESPATGSELDFPVQDNGDQVVRLVGRGVLTVTNLDTDASVTLRGGYRQDLIFHEDGSIDVWINGSFLAGYFPTDVGGPAMWWFNGHLHDTVDGTFTATAHEFVGHATDVCALLS